MLFIKSCILFLSAGLAEIGGGYLVWTAVKGQKPGWYGVVGAVILAFYGLIAAFQPANFGRTYAAYGGVFIVLSLLWGWKIDKFTPDKFDIIGTTIVLVGASVLMFWPRR